MAAMHQSGETDDLDRGEVGHANGWAKPVDHLTAPPLPDGAVNLNVEGRRLTGPTFGFGQLWQKTFRVRLEGSPATPREVIRLWKARFPHFWPKGNHFYGPMEGIAPGSVAVLNLAGPGGAPLISTGIMVVYVDDLSFSFMTPEGHMFAGMITFSAAEVDLATVAEVKALIRANDPLYELSFRLRFGHKAEDEFWKATLRNLATFFGVHAEVRQEIVCLDPTVQWREAKNIWQNAAIRTLLYHIAAPARFVKRIFMRKTRD